MHFLVVELVADFYIVLSDNRKHKDWWYPLNVQCVSMIGHINSHNRQLHAGTEAAKIPE